MAAPDVNLVEAASGYDVGVGEIEEAFVWNFSYTNVPHVGNFARQIPYFNFALLLNRRNRGWDGHACWQVENGRCVDLRIDERFAVGHRAGKVVPATVNVSKNLCLLRGVRFGRVGGGVGRKQKIDDD